MPYYDPETAESTEDFYLGIAADTLQRLAPAPDPLPTPDTYSPRAARGERLLYDYLSSTQGAGITSVSGDPGSVSFASMSAIRDIVRGAMGTYYTADKMRVRRTQRA